MEPVKERKFHLELTSIDKDSLNVRIDMDSELYQYGQFDIDAVDYQLTGKFEKVYEAVDVGSGDIHNGWDVQYDLVNITIFDLEIYDSESNRFMIVDDDLNKYISNLLNK